jgi:hypothetical protein
MALAVFWTALLLDRAVPRAEPIRKDEGLVNNRKPSCSARPLARLGTGVLDETSVAGSQGSCG